MIRRFNYTGRLKIPRSRVNISLNKDGLGKYFTAKLNLDGFKLNANAKVYIDANYKGIYQRYDYGLISDIIEPQNTRIIELPETEIVYFDIYIVDETSRIGMILAHARGIVASTNDVTNDRMPLLPVNPTDLKSQFWKLSFDSSDDGRPLLEVNRNIPEVFEMARNDIKFISLVYPAALRQILYKILSQSDFGSDEDSWVSHWLKFVNIVLGIKNPPDLEMENEFISPEQEEWVDTCVNAFCKKFQLFEKFTVL